MTQFLFPHRGMKIVLTQPYDLTIRYCDFPNELKRLAKISGLGIDIGQIKREREFDLAVFSLFYRIPATERNADDFYRLFLEALETTDIFSEARKDALRAKVAARAGIYDLVAQEYVNLPVGTTIEFLTSESWSTADGRSGASATMRFGGEIDYHIRNALHGPKTNSIRLYASFITKIHFDIL